ncbi:hypothetical protein AAFF_G00273220 [Aldrovandia affinis]|uniref:Uncharacterized protein n=1 Tax=Aldrovandia affinis TaxID=143900 RepID=A0AAD7SRJ2_9TELE|nr:hypothetical protein AAFF_G00273220 [Aldrovandia affinis]
MLPMLKQWETEIKGLFQGAPAGQECYGTMDNTSPHHSNASRSHVLMEYRPYSQTWLLLYDKVLLSKDHPVPVKESTEAALPKAVSAWFAVTWFRMKEEKRVDVYRLRQGETARLPEVWVLIEIQRRFEMESTHCSQPDPASDNRP